MGGSHRGPHRAERGGGQVAPVPTSPGRLIARFSLLFIACNVALVTLTSTAAAGTYLHEPMARCVAFLSWLVLSPFGRTSVSGVELGFNDFGVRIVEACDGILPATIYLSAILAFPSRWADKGWGLLIGLPAIFLINLVRVVTLVMVGAAWPDIFEQVHIYVWQALVIGLAMVIWVFWAERFVRAHLQARS